MPELIGRFDAPLKRGTMEGALRLITLDAPHEGKTKAVVDSEVSGWSKVRARLGKPALEEGDQVIIKKFRVMSEAILAQEIG